MGNAAERMTEPLVPGADEVATAQEASRVLARMVAEAPSARLAVEDASHRVHAVLPPVAVRLLQRILGELSQGRAVSIIPVGAELTTQQAAELLNVSRPHLVSLLKAGALPYRRVGSHRRVLFEDLMKYKRAEEANRLKVLEDMAKQAQELGLGY